MTNEIHVVKHVGIGEFEILHEPQGGWRDGEDEARYFRSLQLHDEAMACLRGFVATACTVSYMRGPMASARALLAAIDGPEGAQA